MMLSFYLSLIENHENDDDFLKIYHKYRQSMHNIAFSYLQNHDYCEDALQITFLGIAKNIETIKKLDEEKIEIYVFKSVKNSALIILKDKNLISNDPYSIDEQFDEISSEEDILKNTIEKDLLKEIITFIKSMDEKYRDVLTLYFLHELTFKEIAIALGKSVSTIKDRFRKGHQLIVKKFKKYKND